MNTPANTRRMLAKREHDKRAGATGRAGMRAMLANLAALAFHTRDLPLGAVIRWNLRDRPVTAAVARQAENPREGHGMAAWSKHKHRQAQRAARVVRMARKKRRGYA